MGWFKLKKKEKEQACYCGIQGEEHKECGILQDIIFGMPARLLGIPEKRVGYWRNLAFAISNAGFVPEKYHETAIKFAEKFQEEEYTEFECRRNVALKLIARELP